MMMICVVENEQRKYERSGISLIIHLRANKFHQPESVYIPVSLRGKHTWNLVWLDAVCILYGQRERDIMGYFFPLPSQLPLRVYVRLCDIIGMAKMHTGFSL